ncbi:unnamed protein product [Leptidea sinapis]|uniref:Uncharacterized protein n=1 Tax=Leptidea sinapis TaxID=189913 RepID=A0A5E4PMV8_9NEOP|nr:unnamed protein product [Leptidea sinapis]
MMQNTFSDFKSDLDIKISKIGENTENIRLELDALSALMNEFKKQLCSLRNDQKTTSEQVLQLSEKQEALCKEMGDVQISIDFTNKINEDVKLRVLKLEKDVKNSDNSLSKILSLKSKIEILEEQARSYNIDISGIPEKRSENLIELMETICRSICFAIDRKDIIAIHRVPQALLQVNRPKNMIVKL